MITQKDLTELAGATSHPAISFYLPTAPSSSETLQATTHLKNLITEASASLEEQGMTASEVEALLSPAVRLRDNAEFWQHQRHGLALFVGRDFHRFYTLENTIEAQVCVADTWVLTPVLDQLSRADQFLVAVVSQKKAQVFSGNHEGLTELAITDLPQGIADLADGSHFENTSYAAPTERPHVGEQSFAHGQSYGDSPSEHQKERLGLYAELIQKALGPVMGSSHLPAVLIADEELAGMVATLLAFHAVDYTHPDALSEAELHELAEKALADHLQSGDDTETDRIMGRLGRKEAIATTLAEIHQAATEGRIETLVVARRDGDIALNQALQATLSTGGTVVWMSEPEPALPEGALALLRY
jgi:hypothetical protein